MKFLCQLPVTVIIIGHHMKKEQLKLFDEVIDWDRRQMDDKKGHDNDRNIIMP